MLKWTCSGVESGTEILGFRVSDGKGRGFKGSGFLFGLQKRSYINVGMATYTRFNIFLYWFHRGAYIRIRF